MVRLITHNLLACNAKSCAPPTNFPLQFRDVSKVEIKPTELNKEFLVTIFNKLDLGALVDASRSLGDTSLPETIPPEQIDNPSEMSDETFQALHHALLEIHVKEGNMVCPSCGHLFAIKDGIPNMLLAEHEIKT